MNFSIYATLYAVTIAGFLVVGVLVALRQRTILYRNFSIFCFLIAAWQAMQFVAQAFLDNGSGVIVFRLSVVASSFMALYFLLFAAAYTGHKLRTLLFYVGSIVAAVAALVSPQLQKADISREGISLPAIDLFYGITILFAGIVSLYGLFLIFRHLLTSHVKRDRQRDLLLIGGISQAVLVVVYLSLFTSGSNQTQIGVPIAVLLAVLIIAYSMMFHGLFDIHFFVVRAAAYLSTLLVMTFLLVVPVIFIFSYFLDFHPTPEVFAAVVVASVFALYILQYFRRVFDRITNNIFFRNYYDPQDVLDDLTNTLVHTTVDAEKLQNKTIEILSNVLHPNFANYLLGEGKYGKLLDLLSGHQDNLIVTDELDNQSHKRLRRELEQQRIALAVRLHTHQGDLGFMIFGFKQSGEMYNVRDRRLINTAADEIAIGLQNAFHLQEIEQFNLTLQDKIDSATSQLRRKNERLRLLDQTKDDFISMASHQLRTPLTSVKGYTSMVLEGDAGKVNPLQRKLLNQAFVSAQRMVYLISDLLNVSRLRTGKFELELVPTNLAEVIASEVEQLKETAASRDLELTYAKPEHFPTYMLDETKMRQVIMNFIDNAIYYTPSGGKIEVALTDKPESIELTVTDTGIGVPKGDQPHMFTKYFRAHNAQIARPDGTGLGLFMAKKVVIAHGGAVIFKSREHKGSAFGFTFSKKHLQTPPPKKTEKS